MTVLYPERFKEAAAAGFDGTFEWDFLIEAFKPTKIQPMDLDCLVERRRRFLAFETKDGDVPIPQGQLITLESLVMTGFFTVVILRGKTADAIQGWEVWYLGKQSNSVHKRWHDGNAADLTAFVKRWFDWASRTPLK